CPRRAVGMIRQRCYLSAPDVSLTRAKIDKETRRQGDKERMTRAPLASRTSILFTPCLLVSLSKLRSGNRHRPVAPLRQQPRAVLCLLAEDADARHVVVPAVALQQLTLRGLLAADHAEAVQVAAPRLLEETRHVALTHRALRAVLRHDARHLVVLEP